MAAVLTGTPVAVTWAAGADPAGQSITIPSDATAVYMFWAYYTSADGNGLASVTLNGASPGQTFEIPTAAVDQTGTGVAVWYNPATGSQTLDPAWDAAPAEGSTCIVAFVKDGDTAAWRDADADNQDSTTACSVTLTTVSGDLVIKFDQRFGTAPSLSSGWTNGQTHSNNSEGSRLSYISATGTTQVCASEDDNYSSVCAISIPASSGGVTSGALDIDSVATLTGSGASTAAGAISIASTAILVGSGASVVSAAASIAATATPQFSGVELHQAAMDVASTAVVSMTGAASASGAVAIDGVSSVVFDARSTNSGAVDIDAVTDVQWSSTDATIVSAAASITATATLSATGAATAAGDVGIDTQAAITMTGAATVAADLGIESEIIFLGASSSSTTAQTQNGRRRKTRVEEDDFLLDLAAMLVPALSDGFFEVRQ